MSRFSARFREEEEADWRFDREFVWPQVRGKRVLDELLADSSRSASKAGDIIVDQVQVTAGHVALVLTTKRAGFPRERTTSPSSSEDATASTTSAANSPYVVFVVDAVPPSRTGNIASTSDSNTMALNSRRRIAGPPVSSSSTSSSSSSSSTVEDATRRRFTVSSFALEADETELILELFNATKSGKDGCLLAKSPLLCVRHDYRVVGVRFTRNANVPSRLSPLRCVVAREDGFAHIWQWQTEEFAWQFCNRLSFLANPNLAWTKPVALFESVALESNDDILELAWWSTESKGEPTLCFRKLRFDKLSNDTSSSHRSSNSNFDMPPKSNGSRSRVAFEAPGAASTHASASGPSSTSLLTEIVVGDPFSVKCAQVTQLFSSQRGFWVLCSDGIFLRSSRTYQTLHTTWSPHLLGDRRRFCVHNVTGEMLVLLGRQGEIVSFAEDDTTLVEKRVRFLHNWQSDIATLMKGMVAHRHCLLVLLESECLVYSLLSGHLLHAIDLPPHRGSPADGFRFWQVNGMASSVGLWSSKNFWWLRTPSAKKLAFDHDDRFQDAQAAFNCMKDFGASARFEIAFFALEVLEQTRLTMEFCHLPAWKAAVETISSPALLLAALGETKSPDQLIKYIEDIVYMMHRIATDVTVTGRFTLNMEKNPDEEDGKYAQHLTPANIESFSRLSNWVLLAKRKLARLKATHQLELSEKRTRARTVSTLHTEAFAENASFGSNCGESGWVGKAKKSEELAIAQEQPVVTSPYSFSRKLAHMSCLRFAACCCSLAHGSKWIAQLEAFLLEGVSLSKSAHVTTTRSLGVKAPSHLLFHEERVLVDFHSSTSTFSKHMYFELLGRLYLFQEPTLLPAFVTCVSAFCPKFFSLIGSVQLTRSHAERVLLLLPSPHLFVTKWHMEQAEMDAQIAEADAHAHALTRQVIMAYVELHCLCGFFQEASRLLLDCGFVEECKRLMQRDGISKACSQAIYFEMMEYCVVQQRSVDELESVVRLKPRHVNALQVFHALREFLTRPIVATTTGASATESHLTVGALRPVLMWLLKCSKIP